MEFGDAAVEDLEMAWMKNRGMRWEVCGPMLSYIDQTSYHPHSGGSR